MYLAILCLHRYRGLQQREEEECTVAGFGSEKVSAPASSRTHARLREH